MLKIEPKYKRFLLILTLLAFGCLSAFFALKGFQEEVAYFKKPSEFRSEKILHKKYRIGGLVKEGSFQYDFDQLEARFVITDYKTDVTIHYVGVLPDLFKENQVVVVEGEFENPRQFEAKLVLAKHDENYRPPQLDEL